MGLFCYWCKYLNSIATPFWKVIWIGSARTIDSHIHQHLNQQPIDRIVWAQKWADTGMTGSGISAPSLWGSSKPRVCRFCRWWSWQAFYPPMVVWFAWSLLDWMCFQTTFGNGVICPLLNRLNFELCLFISMLAGHKFALAEMCRFYTLWVNWILSPHIKPAHIVGYETFVSW